ncbi:EAL domain-containing protein [uncultured Devosia sp.]|uniref:putative bifunctional diguanylate cyclase/phosphodiesterase n=1 Tax=uncultured Devosia sp. TaxID=211434 RepID=UPI00262BF045|nr:EAL domain-containing protein [uncultured Devosia sp.]
MPALDYVSIVRSVYGDRAAMLGGVFATATTSGLAAYSTQSAALYVITAAFLVIGFIRDANTRAFWRASIANDDVVAAERWETRAVWTGGPLALTYGLWCLISMGFVRDPFAELSSASITIAVTVGIVARNFGLDRLVTIQTSLVIIPLSIGYVLLGDLNHIVLAAMLAVMLVSFRKLAGDIRAILLAAVHGREEASRLAAELDIAITTLEHGLCMLDENGLVTVANERASSVFAMLGIRQLANQPFGSVLAALGATNRVPRTAIEQLGSMISRRASGKVLLSLSPGRYYEVTISSRGKRSVLLFEDISERVEAEERISYMARHDTLTNLPNRNYFGELAHEDLEVRAASGTSSALMIFDIDEFKHVNDSFGHVIGDKLLRQTANRLRETLPEGTTLARLGGDEFIALSGHDAEQTRADVQRVLDAFQQPFVLDGHHLSAKVSIGVVTSLASQDDLDELMTKADLALYAAKGEGKGRSQFFHAQMDIDYHYRQRLKTDLREAVAAGELTLVFQPLLDITTRRVVSCEALARWTHPELGPIAPATFIPLAEEMGMISDITAFVVRNAVAQCSQWAGDIGVAVNVSARDFRGLDLPALVDEALAAANLPAHRLELEVTETAVIEERELAQSVLQNLSERGIVIALDDFGTGYSSLSYLSALPFAKLKIDRSFVQDIASDARAMSLLSNVARLGRDLDLVVVAEGVETEEQLNAMLDHTGIQQVQGYFFSRPLPARDIAELIGRLNGKGVPLAPANRKHG